MGRTIPTTGIILQREKALLKPYRKALTKTYQREFDEMWVMVSKYQMPCSYADHPLPIYLYMISILVEQRKEIHKIRVDCNRESDD